MPHALADSRGVLKLVQDDVIVHMPKLSVIWETKMPVDQTGINVFLLIRRTM